MSQLEKILKKRQKIIKKYSTETPNYFNWQDYLDLENYSTYITITPRGVGKTYAAFDLGFEWYETTGEYTTWIRTSLEELKECVTDYKSNPPHPKLTGETSRYEWQGKNLVDKDTGKIVVKFVALSTVHNMASITGNGCGLVIYDEFLPRTNRRLPRAYFKLADFLRTLERKDLITVVLQANATTMNSDILLHWDIWNDVDEVTDKDRRLWYRRFVEWENPPKVESVSTSAMWARNDDSISKYADSAQFIDGDDGMVIPESRLGSLRYYYQYKLNGMLFTQALTDDNKWVLVEGARMSKAPVYVLTTSDGFEKGRFVRPLDLKQQMQQIYYALERDALTFTSYELKDELFKFLDMIYGKVQRNRE